jgi:hypothetical protein
MDLALLGYLIDDPALLKSACASMNAYIKTAADRDFVLSYTRPNEDVIYELACSTNRQNGFIQRFLKSMRNPPDSLE